MKKITKASTAITETTRKRAWSTTKPQLKKLAVFAYVCVIFALVLSTNVYATEDVFTAANRIIRTVYNSIAGISTVLAGLMSTVAVIGAKLSNNQQKTDQSWDWLKRIWVAWAIINGIGAFIAYITPLFRGLNTLTP